MVAQRLLQKPVSVQMRRQPLGAVLKELERRSGAQFSYNSDAVPTDSMVSVAVAGVPLRTALQTILGSGYEFKERGGHVVIRVTAEGGSCSVSGYLYDRETGEPVLYASVYEPKQLVSAITDDRGYFRLKLKTAAPADLTFRHMGYGDTAVRLRPGRDAEIAVSVAPRATPLDSIVVVPRSALQRTFFGRVFTSSRQRLHDLNLGSFVADAPFQLSLVPGLGTHGRMSSNVVDKLSINVLGGYSAGVRGVQVGSLFNLVRGDVRGVQTAGLFSLVGGSTGGAQAAGLYNGVFGNMRGAQASGIASHVAGAVDGVQASGVSSVAGDTLRGVQASGVASYAGRGVRGLQVSGVANVSGGTVRGAQVAGVVNVARRVDGLQVGLINVADTADGYTLGLLNIVRSGVHELEVSGNEVTPLNLSLKTGTPKLYSILTVGAAPERDGLWTFGAGLGRSITLGKAFGLRPELTARHLQFDGWKGANILSRADLIVQWRVAKGVRIGAGPAFSVYTSNRTQPLEGFFLDVPPANAFEFGGSTSGWVGGTVGVSFF